jgi:hypothetical protein
VQITSGAESPGNLVYADGIPVYCRYSAIIPVGEVKPNPGNPNKHPDEQIKKLAYVVESNGWRNPIVVSTRSGLIVKGHGRLMAAVKLGKCAVPVEYQDYESEAAELADLMADNRIAELSSINVDAALEIMDKVENKEAAGYSVSEVAEWINTMKQEAAEEKYTRLIEVPRYTPAGECPEIEDLYDDSKAVELIREVEASGASEAEKVFLRLAAYRHTVISFKHVAEYYAHAGKELQWLMERSALVIIDYDDAISYGFVEAERQIDKMMEAAFNAE